MNCMRFLRQWVFAITTSLLSISLALAAGEATTVLTPAQGGIAQLPREAQGNWWAGVQRDIVRSEYNISRPADKATGEAGEWQAPNRAHGLRTRFTSEGPRVTPRIAEGADWVWGLELTGFGGPGPVTAPPAVEDVCVTENRIAFERNGLTEWYVNSEAGLEQGFTLAQNPTGNGVVVVRMAVRGNLAANMTPDGGIVEFLSAAGVGAIRYGKLRVVDATGRELSAAMALKDGNATLELQTDTTGAVFPVIIDPLAMGGNNPGRCGACGRRGVPRLSCNDFKRPCHFARSHCRPAGGLGFSSGYHPVHGARTCRGRGGRRNHC